jgi:hypothetical protein
MTDGKIIMPRRHGDTKVTELWIISKRVDDFQRVFQNYLAGGHERRNYENREA